MRPKSVQLTTSTHTTFAWILVASCVIGLVGNVVLVPLTWHYRKRFPVHNRGVGSLLLLLAASFLTYIALICSPFVDCWGKSVSLFAGFLVALVWCLRGLRLLFMFKLSFLAYDVEEGRISESAFQKSFYTRHAWWASKKGLSIIAAVNIILQLLLLAVPPALGWVQLSHTYCLDLASTDLYLFIAQSQFLVLVCASLFLGCLIRRFPDDRLLLKQEFLHLGGIMLGMSVSVIVADLLFGLMEQHHIYETVSAWQLIISLAWAGGYPLYKTREFSTPAASDGLEALLMDARRKLGFLAFLKTEFSTENLLFWNSVQDLLSSGQSKPTKAGAGLLSDVGGSSEEVDSDTMTIESIISRYVRVGSPLEVNISHQCRAEIIDAMAGEDRARQLETLKAGAKQVLDLLERDSYPRFRRWAKTNERNSMELTTFPE